MDSLKFHKKIRLNFSFADFYKEKSFYLYFSYFFRLILYFVIFFYKNVKKDIVYFQIVNVVEVFEIFDEICKWALKYAKNGVLALNLGTKRIVILGELNLIEDSFGKDALNFRPPTFSRFGIAGNQGEKWRKQFEMLANSLGKFASEDVMRLTFKHMEQRLLELCDRGFMDPRSLLSKAVFNVISLVMMGNEYDYEDPELVQMTNHVLELTDTMDYQGGIIQILLQGRHKEKEQKLEILKTLLSHVIAEHKKSLNPSNPRDFIDEFLITANDSAELSKEEVNEEILQMLLDVMLLGVEKTTSTLCWSVLLMVRNPSVQRRVREELNRSVGEEKFPTLADANKLPFTVATLQVKIVMKNTKML